jgi:hypothetical protein
VIEDYFSGRTAVERLSDPALLAKVAARAKNHGLRRAAVRRLLDQVTLASDEKAFAKIAAEHSCYVPQDAVEKLTDQEALARVFMLNQNSYVRDAALKKLTDPASLARVAMEASNVERRLEAVHRLRDSSLLVKVATTTNDWRVGRAAVEKLCERAPLEEIAKKAKNPDTRERARSVIARFVGSG